MRDRDELSAARRLRTAVERLPRELHPARDLWPEIAGRLAERPRRRPMAAGGEWWRLAAAVTLMAGGLLAAALLAPEAPPAGAPTAAASRQAVPMLAAARLRQHDGVVHVHDDLRAAAARRRSGLDAAGAAALDAGLAELERATAEIDEALAARPDDRRLRLALAAAYRREAAWATRWSRAPRTLG